MLELLFLGNSLGSWLTALSLFLLIISLTLLVRQILLRHLGRLARSTHWWIDDVLVEVLRTNPLLLAMALGIFVSLPSLDVQLRTQVITSQLTVGMLIVQTGLWIHRGLHAWLHMRFAAQEAEVDGARIMTRSLLSFLGKLTLWTVVLLLVLDNLGLNVTALVASLGIGGVAVALAVQNVLGDLFASLSIAIDKPFVVGDFIMVDDLMGTVEQVGLKTTRMKSLHGEQIVFSNNDLLSSRIRNYKRMAQRRCTFAFGVTYSTPATVMQQIPAMVEAVVQEQAQVRFDRAHFKAFGASSLDFEVVYFVLSADYNVYMDVQQAINLGLMHRFAQAGIEFAFPTQTLHLQGHVQWSPQ